MTRIDKLSAGFGEANCVLTLLLIMTPVTPYIWPLTEDVRRGRRERFALPCVLKIGIDRNVRRAYTGMSKREERGNKGRA